MVVAAVTSPSFPQAHALLIAIADYDGARRLPQAVINDAQDLATLLRSPATCGYDSAKVRVLLNAEATRTTIFAELDRLAKEAGPNDTVCIYFSGHGWRHRDSEDSFLLPVDAVRADLDHSAIPATTLSERLQAIRAARLMVFLDACHAGGAGTVKDGFGGEAENVGLSSKSIDILSSGAGRAIIASSRAEETSLIMPGARNSAFTTALIEGLKGAADFHCEGSIKLFSLYEYISDRVPALTADRQHPILRTKLEKNFVIALSPGSYMAAKAPLSSTPRLRDTLQSILPTLYPGGPTDRDIWERAGGDLAEITLSKSGRSMWFEAVKLINNGGGGDIDVRSLVTEALKDYPRNKTLLALS